MTEPRFAMSANVHRPSVKSVYRLPADHAGVRLLSINLGDPKGYGHVSLLVTDEQWRAIVRDTDREIARVDLAESVKADIARSVGDNLGDADYAIRCPEFVNGCAETFEGDAKMELVTEHMFAAHPEAVAR